MNVIIPEQCVCVCETELAAETSLCRLKGFINGDGAFLKPQLTLCTSSREKRTAPGSSADEGTPVALRSTTGMKGKRWDTLCSGCSEYFTDPLSSFKWYQSCTQNEARTTHEDFVAFPLKQVSR